MQRPKIDDKLTLLADFGKTDAICAEVLDNPATEEGILLKVMARGPFQEGQQIWIVDRDGSKIGATVENVSKQTIDSEVTLSTVLPAQSEVGSARCADRTPQRASLLATSATAHCSAAELRQRVSFHRGRGQDRPAQGRCHGSHRG